MIVVIPAVMGHEWHWAPQRKPDPLDTCSTEMGSPDEWIDEQVKAYARDE